MDKLFLLMAIGLLFGVILTAVIVTIVPGNNVVLAVVLSMFLSSVGVLLGFAIGNRFINT